MTEIDFTVLCPFGGSGGGALGFLDAEVRLLGHVGRFRCLGSIDFDTCLEPITEAAFTRGTKGGSADAIRQARRFRRPVDERGAATRIRRNEGLGG